MDTRCIYGNEAGALALLKKAFFFSVKKEAILIIAQKMGIVEKHRCLVGYLAGFHVSFERDSMNRSVLIWSYRAGWRLFGIGQVCFNMGGIVIMPSQICSSVGTSAHDKLRDVMSISCRSNIIQPDSCTAQEAGTRGATANSAANIISAAMMSCITISGVLSLTLLPLLLFLLLLLLLGVLVWLLS